MAIRAVLFDLDGTLWDSTWPIEDFGPLTSLQAEAVSRHISHWPPPVSPTSFITRFWEAFGSERGRIWGEPELRELDTFSLMAAHLAAVAPEPSAELINAVLDAVASVPFREYGVTPFPESATVLATLAERGIHLAVVTNRTESARVIARELTALGLPDVFSAVVTSGDQGYRKPHRAPFEAALAAVGAQPEEALFVGDHPEQDIAGAIQVGLTAVLRRGPNNRGFERVEAHHVVDSLEELLPIVFAELVDASPIGT